MEYTLIRSKRRTISIRVTEDAVVVVRAPKKSSLHSIESFLNSKSAWIQTHVEKAQRNIDSRHSFELNYGDIITIRGDQFTIKMTEQDFSFLSLESKSLCLPKDYSSTQLLNSARNLLIDYANTYLPERTEYFARIMKLQPSSIRVGKAKSRWGSCNSSGKITLTWRIIMSEQAIIDYLIIHELAHLRHMNHSASFWNEVSKYAPDYKERRRLLREYSKSLDCTNW